jgi:TldD protein
MIKDVNLAAYANRFSEYTELRAQRNTNARIGLLNGDVTTNTRSVDSGVSARVFKDGVWGFASEAELSPAAIEAVVADATANAAFLAGHAPRDLALPADRASFSSDFATRRQRLPRQQVIRILKGLDEHIAGRFPGLKARSLVLWDLDMEKQLYNSDASSSYSNVTRSLIRVQLVAEDDSGQPVELGRAFGGRGQFEDVFADSDGLHDQIDELHEHLMRKRTGVSPRPGEQDVILDSELAGILAHEAVGHTTEADIVQEGSIAGDRVGQPVASELVTMIDFANTLDGETLPVPVYVDDEGVESHDTILIKDGVLQGFMHNKESAAHFQTELTGNARAYQFYDEPLIRMRNTAIMPGKDKLEDMIASVENGYYLMWPSNGQADSTSEFMFGVTLGYEIVDGQLGRAITDTTISGVAFDMLKSITMVSDQMSWSCAGMCGKKQIIPVGMGGPAVKCRIHIGGQG